MSYERIRGLASRAIRLSADDGKITGFDQREKSIVDNIDFLYWLVTLAELDEREACITELERNADKTLEEIFAAIRARGNK